MGKTTIEWVQNPDGSAGYSINPIRARLNGAVGHYCEKISRGCAHCYASRLQSRFKMPEFDARNRSRVIPFLDVGKLHEVLRRRSPTRYFWCDMTDLFGDWVPDAWIAACFAVMAGTPHHIHLVLTKRAARLPVWFTRVETEARAHGFGPHVAEFCAFVARVLYGVETDFDGPRQDVWPLPHVHLGVSVEDKRTRGLRVPQLLRTPAAVKWISAEPLLQDIADDEVFSTYFSSGFTEPPQDDVIRWVVAGAESGPGARPMSEDWVRHLRDACRLAGVPFFYKQNAINGKKISTPTLDGRRWVEVPAILPMATPPT